MPSALRDLTRDDLPALLALNNAATPAVPTATEDELAALLEASDFGFAVGDELLGFVLGFAPGSDYQSPNYRWFEARGIDHLYVDRIVVAEAARGRSIGRLLYERVIGLAREQGRREVTCEVNLDPPNPGPLAFHDRMGFREVGQQEPGYATVSHLPLPLG